MIIRILGEGQYTIDDAHSDMLNALDSGLERAVESGDDDGFRSALRDLLAQVHTSGEPLAMDTLEPSDCILPGEDSTLDEVRAMLDASTEGLIPG